MTFGQGNAAPIDSNLYASELRAALSVERMERYGGENDREVVINHLWNLQLCEAFYPTLCTVELVLRNSINTALVAHTGLQDWYDVINLSRDELRALNATKRKIAASNRHLAPGRIIAGLNFGFWTGILSGLYGNSPKGPMLWTSPNSPLLMMVFPNAPGHIQQYRGKIHRRLDDIRRFRNRVFHYESIFDDHYLVTRHQEIIDVILWMNLTLADLADRQDRFPEIHANGRLIISRAVR